MAGSNRLACPASAAAAAAGVNYGISSRPAKATAVCAKSAWVPLTYNSAAMTVAFHRNVIVVVTCRSSLQAGIWHSC
jgi:hypothetical protein